VHTSIVLDLITEVQLQYDQKNCTPYKLGQLN
jgi:hypothetical protein